LRELGAGPPHEQTVLRNWSRGWQLDTCRGEPERFFPQIPAHF